MNKGTIVIIIFIVAVIVGVAIIDAGVRRPIDWGKNYNQREKSPFGLYVLHQELSDFLPHTKAVEDFGDYYELLTRLDSFKKYDETIVHIGNYDWMHDEDLEYTLKYVNQGGAVFMSTPNIDYKLIDTLNLHIGGAYTEEIYPSDKNTSYSLVGAEKRIQLEKSSDFQFFTKLDKNTSKILGYMHIDEHALPNFVEVSYGKGKFYFHTAPLVFTNYHILQEDAYDYAVSVLNVVNGEKIQWYDSNFFWDEPKTPLRVILKSPGFSQAWYLLLTALLLLLLFKSRREQRAVKVVVPEPNLSKEFARTIGSLYYENGDPGNVILKKIDYFLYDLRNAYQIETLDLTNKKMISTLSLKSGVDIEEVQTLMRLMQYYQQINVYHIDDLKKMNNVIEDFKHKAKMV